MKLGRTSFLYFISKVVATVAGFLVTIFLARELGADTLGVYFLLIGLVSWVTLPATSGIKSAISKRLSESDEQGAYLLAGGITMSVLVTIVVVAVYAFRGQVTSYLGYGAIGIVVMLVIADTVFHFVVAVLTGQRRVHVVGLLSPVNTFSRGSMQVVAVFFGAGLFGILLAHVAGLLVTIGVGLVATAFVFERPQKRHFKSLLSFAQFSWLGAIRSRTFNRLDIIILGFFVSSGLIGIYSISWNVASFLGIFAQSISSTLFPELSRLSAEDETEEVSRLVQVSFSYAGLVHIPGLVGVALLGGRVLRIYGEEFIQGQTVLVVLVLAYLVHSYHQQVLTALDGLDRPELTFRTNAVLILSNVVLNILLVFLYGWIGAAVATTLSISLSFALGYYYLTSLTELSVPYRMVGKQVSAALVMGAVVYAGLRAEAALGIVSNNVVLVLALVGIGGCTYFSLLLLVSAEFRMTVSDNVPFV